MKPLKFEKKTEKQINLYEKSLKSLKHLKNTEKKHRRVLQLRNLLPGDILRQTVRRSGRQALRLPHFGAGACRGLRDGTAEEVWGRARGTGGAPAQERPRRRAGARVQHDPGLTRIYRILAFLEFLVLAFKFSSRSSACSPHGTRRRTRASSSRALTKRCLRSRCGGRRARTAASRARGKRCFRCARQPLCRIARRACQWRGSRGRRCARSAWRWTTSRRAPGACTRSATASPSARRRWRAFWREPLCRVIYFPFFSFMRGLLSFVILIVLIAANSNLLSYYIMRLKSAFKPSKFSFESVFF